MYHILIISEDSVLFDRMKKEGKSNKLNYQFQVQSESNDISEFILNNPTSLIIVPNINLIAQLKSNTTLSKIPILMWAPCGLPSTEMYALGHGADSYFNQLSSWDLLFSQINSLLRKIVVQNQEQQSHMKKFIFFPNTLEVEFHGSKIKLSTKEFTIFTTLVENPGRIYSQKELNDITSGADVHVSPRTIDTFVSSLRKKIGYTSITSIRNKGYRINEEFLATAQG